MYHIDNSIDNLRTAGMATIRGYMGVSADHYLASPDGTLDWLRKYDKVDFGEHSYERFIKGIRTVVMGRTTYDEIPNFNIGWPYAAQRAIVVTSRPTDKPIGKIEVWDRGVDALIAYLCKLDDGDVWIAGGGKLQQAFIERGGLDRLELFVVPEIVGAGIPLFPPNGFARTVKLTAAEPLAAGVVRLVYDFPAAA